MVVSTVKFGWLEWQLQVLLKRSYQYLSLVNRQNQDASKTSKASLSLPVASEKLDEQFPFWWMGKRTWLNVCKRKSKVILIADNSPAHRIIEGLKAVELVFLPPNTTWKTQPMDQGVIRSLKAKYRKKSFSGQEKRTVSQNTNFRCDAIINISLIWNIWGNHQKLF